MRRKNPSEAEIAAVAPKVEAAPEEAAPAEEAAPEETLPKLSL